MFGKETETVLVKDPETGTESWMVQLTGKDRAWLDALDDRGGGFERERRKARIRGRKGDTELPRTRTVRASSRASSSPALLNIENHPFPDGRAG